MNKHNSVPKLNLEPKLKRPLSLWNPLDYFRLLYWILFFPQAIRWYADQFGGGYVECNPNPDAITSYQNWRAEMHRIRHNKIQFRLLLQGLSISALVPFSIGIFQLSNTDIPSFLVWIENFDAFFGLFMGVFYGLFIATTSSVAAGVAVSLPYGIAMGITINNFDIINVNTATVLAGGLSFGLFAVSNLRGGIAPNRIFCFIQAGLVSFFFIAVQSIAASQKINVLDTSIVFKTIFVCFIFSLATQLAALRFDCWLPCLIFNLSIRDRNWLFAHTTSIPLLSITAQLKNWLRQDWESGIDNADRLLQYSQQFIPVVRAVNRVIAEMPSEQIIYRVSNLTKIYDGWRLIYFVSASLQRELLLSILPFRSWLGKKLKQQDLLSTKPRIDTPARATAAGFWYLRKQQPDKAAEAFERVRSLLYGEEVYTLAKTLALFQPATELDRIANLDVPAFPQDDLLRGVTWETIANLRRVVEDVKVIQNSISQTTKALALNRAIGELTAILDTSEILPEAERELIIKISQNWKQALERIARDIGDITVTKPVANPYVIGDPVQGSLFAGRDDIMRQLEELWLNSTRLQSVVLYGHRRMGKTSILLNVTNYSNTKIEVAYVNLQRLGTVTLGLGEVLIAITDEIATALQIPPPEDEMMLKLPQRTFERYLKSALASTSCQGLIIALDEFETIERLIEQGQIPAGFMGFLRGLMQMSPKIAFVFAGLHTLEEMTADYFQPFFASVIPLHVGFLNLEAASQILVNPALGDDFFLDYSRETLNYIYSLTAGQPYLVQLIGFQLVHGYNQQIFEGKSPVQTFTPEDVTAILNRELFQKGRYYFEGVWRQAAQGATGQQEILKAIAFSRNNITHVDLIAATNLAQNTLDEATAASIRHDVIAKSDRGWKIVVELFCLWIVNTN